MVASWLKLTLYASECLSLTISICCSFEATLSLLVLLLACLAVNLSLAWVKHGELNSLQLRTLQASAETC